MKTILMSIRPEWVAKILNGEKTIEIRKKFPKDYVGWVYIYVTHGRQLLDLRKEDTKDNFRLTISKSNNVRWSYPPLLNGKVVARFWCDKVEKWDIWQEDLEEKLKLTCLSIKEFDDYSKGQVAYAIHITKLELFDKPKKLNEFWTSNYNKGALCDNEPQFPCTKCPNTGPLYCNCKFLLNGNCSCVSLTKAPQSWCYVEL